MGPRTSGGDFETQVDKLFEPDDEEDKTDEKEEDKSEKKD